MIETAAERRRRVNEFRGLPNWCPDCGRVLCCRSCFMNHRPMCVRAAESYGISDMEFERKVRKEIR
jgi:hypothetical protein